MGSLRLTRHGRKRSSPRASRFTPAAILSPKLAELLSIAVDASITHMYAPGTRRHIQSALKLGATMEEIMEVLKICVAQGMQASQSRHPHSCGGASTHSTEEKERGNKG